MGAVKRQRKTEQRTSREHDAFLVDREGVDDSVVAREVVDKRSFGTLPLLDAKRGEIRYKGKNRGAKEKREGKEGRGGEGEIGYAD